MAPRILLPLLGILLGAVVWQAHRYGTFGWPQEPLPPTPQDVLPPAYLTSARQNPVRVITFFGASNYARNPAFAPLAKALTACAGEAVTVRTVARAGMNSDWGMEHLEEALEGTDLLVIGFNGNDASLWRGIPLARSLANHETFLREARGRGLMVFLSGGASGPGAPETIRGSARLIRPGLNAYAAQTGAHLARREGVGRVPPDTARLALSEEERRALSPDGLHQTEEAILRFTLPHYLSLLRPLACPE